MGTRAELSASGSSHFDLHQSFCGPRPDKEMTRRTSAISGISWVSSLELGAGMRLRVWRDADFIVNYERVVAKRSGEPDAQTVRFTIRQLW
jgi:hypothetical protein